MAHKAPYPLYLHTEHPANQARTRPTLCCNRYAQQHHKRDKTSRWPERLIVVSSRVCILRILPTRSLSSRRALHSDPTWQISSPESDRTRRILAFFPVRTHRLPGALVNVLTAVIANCQTYTNHPPKQKSRQAQVRSTNPPSMLS